MQLTKKVCENVIKNYLQRENVKVIDYELKTISEDAEGFLGEHFKLNINYEINDEKLSHSFFLKTKPNKNKIQKELSDELQVYKREIFLYNFLLKEFEKQGFDTSFAAKSYFCIDDETLILEDVTQKGFSITDRHVDLTLSHVKCSLQALALYHAAGFAFEKRKSENLGKPFSLNEYKELEELTFMQHIDKNSYSMKWWDSSLKTLYILIDLLVEEDEFKTQFKNLIINANLGKTFVVDLGISKTCGHGDLWSNNLMFKYDTNTNTPIKCCLVDFQILRYFYPCFDVLLVIYSNTSVDFRKRNLDNLLKYYYNCLKETLKRYGYDVETIHPENDFYTSVKYVKLEVFLQMVPTKVIVNLPKKILNNCAKKEDEFLEVIFNNDALASEAFQTDENYRTIVSETLYELYEVVLQRKHLNI